MLKFGQFILPSTFNLFRIFIKVEKHYETSLHDCDLHGYLWQLV